MALPCSPEILMVCVRFKWVMYIVIRIVNRQMRLPHCVEKARLCLAMRPATKIPM
jgi:hypothetical protein